MTIASFAVLVGLLLAPPAVYCVGLSVSIGHSLTLPCHGDSGRDVEWWFKQSEYPRWLPVAELHTGSFSPGSGFHGRVESFHLTEPGNYSLTLSPVVYNDLGIYECRYKDKILSDIILEPRVPVPIGVSIAVGISTNVPCFVNLNKQAHAGDLNIHWMRGGEVYQLHNNNITYGPGFENRASLSPEQALYGNMSLTIRQTRFSDEGDYECFYRTEKGKERGNPDIVRLVVSGHPPQTLTVKAGGLLSIPLYTADPARVTFSDEVVMLYANKGPARFGERCAQRCEFLAQNYTLLLRSVTLEDAGVYNVIDPQTNRTIGSISLQVSGPPPSTGFSAGAVAGIVLGVLLLELPLLGVLLRVKIRNIIRRNRSIRAAD